MFLSFNPLVSLLNSLQVLKMQLHQSINLQRERNGGREKVRDAAHKKMGEIRVAKKRARRRDRISQSETEDILFTIICDKNKQQILTFQRLELTNSWHFCLKNDRNTLSSKNDAKHKRNLVSSNNQS